jgi:hypothetical protein
MTRPTASAPIGIAFLGNNNSRRETLAKDEVKREYYTGVREPYTTLSPAQKAKIEAEIAELKNKYLTTKNVKN